MEYSRKMVLVPQEVYDTFIKSKNHPKPEECVEPEEKLHDLLQDQQLSSDHKMKLYNHELQKIMDSANSTKSENIEKEQDSDDEEISFAVHDNKSQIEREVLASLPRSLQTKGKLLLERLKANNITWNTTGELIINSQRYDGTNIIDLVNDIMRNRKYSAPFGWQIFADQLIRLNVPQEMVVNKSRWNYIQKRKTSVANVEKESEESSDAHIEVKSWASY